MTTKQTSTFSPAPADATLNAMLGASRSRWDRLIAGIEQAHAPVTREWHHSVTTGRWHLRLKHKVRTILYLLPSDGVFLTAFVLGKKAVAAARAQKLPAPVLTALNAAQSCAAGHGISLATANARDVATMLKLAAIKMAN